MKNLLFLTAVAATVATIAFTGCKPSEANYRAAYERTMARDSARTDFSETIYGAQRRNVRNVAVPTAAGDTLQARMVRVGITKDGGGIRENIKRWCVIAGDFKQLFNAKSLRDRLADNGYPGAFVVNTGEPYYYVVAASYDDQAPAEATLRKLTENPPFRLRTAPYLLRPAQIR